MPVLARSVLARFILACFTLARLYSPVPPIRNVDVDMISFAESGIFPNVAFRYQTHVPLHITQSRSFVSAITCILRRYCLARI